MNETMYNAKYCIKSNYDVPVKANTSSKKIFEFVMFSLYEHNLKK